MSVEKNDIKVPVIYWIGLVLSIINAMFGFGIFFSFCMWIVLTASAVQYMKDIWVSGSEGKKKVLFSIAVKTAMSYVIGIGVSTLAVANGISGYKYFSAVIKGLEIAAVLYSMYIAKMITDDIDDVNETEDDDNDEENTR